MRQRKLLDIDGFECTEVPIMGIFGASFVLNMTFSFIQAPIATIERKCGKPIIFDYCSLSSCHFDFESFVESGGANTNHGI